MKEPDSVHRSASPAAGRPKGSALTATDGYRELITEWDLRSGGPGCALSGHSCRRLQVGAMESVGLESLVDLSARHQNRSCKPDPPQPKVVAPPPSLAALFSYQAQPLEL